MAQRSHTRTIREEEKARAERQHKCPHEKVNPKSMEVDNVYQTEAGYFRSMDLLAECLHCRALLTCNTENPMDEPDPETDWRPLNRKG